MPDSFLNIDQPPWLIPDRVNRMRYLVDYLVVNNEVCIIVQDGALFVAKSNEGRWVCPVWPNEECYHATIPAELAAAVEPKVLDLSEFQKKVLDDLREDELLAVFPSASMEYEQFEAEEMRQAISYRQKYWRQKAGNTKMPSIKCRNSSLKSVEK